MAFEYLGKVYLLDLKAISAGRPVGLLSRPPVIGAVMATLRLPGQRGPKDAAQIIA